ncbi:MAG: DUF1850 domain-containing protein [Betaproteobacteria bacterium HGW-Betaproteobacteria-3]|jgi:hypothetical protein|nr:MAG: DUF1850 domain-containing protein [Betaproteobacteria bacterium HGW-Betaproteobacteria-3]
MPLGVCLALASALAPGPALPVFVPAERFTLAWTHSIEKIRWEEDYAVVAPARTGSPPQLLAVGARVRGSGAGMEPPPDAVLRNGWYEYRPTTPPLTELRLTRSAYTADYEWCTAGRCQPMGALLPADGDVTLLWPCTGPQAHRRR